MQKKIYAEYKKKHLHQAECSRLFLINLYLFNFLFTSFFDWKFWCILNLNSIACNGRLGAKECAAPSLSCPAGRTVLFLFCCFIVVAVCDFFSDDKWLVWLIYMAKIEQIFSSIHFSMKFIVLILFRIYQFSHAKENQ